MDKGGGYLQTLDALRGVAAIAVLLFHAPGIGEEFVPGGYLAVDLFFMLSGAVMAHSYRGRLALGLPSTTLLRWRAIRLWPMLALGALFGVLLHGGAASSLFLIPTFTSPASLFPANPPLWSLLFEAIAYVIFAVGLWRAGPRLLAALAVLAGLALIWLVVTSPHPLIDFGAHWPTAAAGLARVSFGFITGMMLWHLWQGAGSPRLASNLGWLLLPPLIAIMLLVPQTGGASALVAILVVFPIICWLALCWQVPQAGIARQLGNLSYPLYCIHMPLLVWLAAKTGAVLPWVLLLPILALMTERWIDRPMRKWLARIGNTPGDQTRIGIST